jgi:hypothetical protein
MKRRITSGNDNNADGKNQSFNLRSIGSNLPPKTLAIENNIDNRELEDFFKNIQDSKVYKTILTTLNCPEIIKLLDSKIINLRTVASFFEDIGWNVITFESILKHPGIIETLGLSKKWELLDTGKIKLSDLSELFIRVGSNIESFKKIMREDIVRLLNENILADPHNGNDSDSFHELWNFLDNLPTGQVEIYTEEDQELNRLNVETKYTEHQIEIYTRIFNIPGIIDLLSKNNCDEQFVYLEQLSNLFSNSSKDIDLFQRIMTTPGVMELLGINDDKIQHVALDVLDKLFHELGHNIELFERVMKTPGVMELFKTQQIDLDMLCELFQALNQDIELFERVMKTPGVMELLTTPYSEGHDCNELLALLTGEVERLQQGPRLLLGDLTFWCQDMRAQNILLSQEILDNMVRDVMRGNFFDVDVEEI